MRRLLNGRLTLLILLNMSLLLLSVRKRDQGARGWTKAVGTLDMLALSLKLAVLVLTSGFL